MAVHQFPLAGVSSWGRQFLLRGYDMAKQIKIPTWQTYEIKKKEIADQNLPAEEYERKIKELTSRLRI